MSTTRTSYIVRRPQARRRVSRLRKFVFYMQLGLLLVFGFGIGAICATFLSVSRMLPKVTDYSPPEVTKIYSSDNILLATVGEENREVVGLDEIPKNLVNATVAIEDKRFYEHGGVDFRGIARAAVKNVIGGKIDEGGSTITQQLARNVFLTQRKTISRKMREAVLAVMIERNYTKTRILELYMNQIFYGSGAFGVQAASKSYFGKDVKNLDLAECALLAGLPQAPTRLSPHRNLDLAVERRNNVLARMKEQGYITPEQQAEAKAETPRIVDLKPTKYRSRAPYFTDYVKEYLSEKYSYDDLVYRGGLRVYTTVNYRMQEAAQKALSNGIRRARTARQINRINGNGALISIEPGTGYIRAMVGGADYTDSHAGEFNRAIKARRQPGSAFKAFVYTAAVDTLGWDANHVILGGHYTYSFGDGRTWSPRNYDGRYPGSMTVKQAVAKSVNVPAVRTALQVGLPTVVRYAHLLGIKSEIEAYPAMAIGGIKGIRPIEMAAAYSVFASGGYYAEPTPIAKILSADGDVIEETKIEPRRVLSERTVGVMDQLFRAVVTQGTAAWKLARFRDARGKTGTTNNDVDVWFIGYVPKKLVTAVWVGNDNNTPMRDVSGSGICAPIWGDFMQQAVQVYDQTHRPAARPRPRPVATEERPRENTTPPTPRDEINAVEETDGGAVRVKICDESQLIARKACPSYHIETFAKGTEPTAYCNIHGRRSHTGEGRQPAEPKPEENAQPTPTPPEGEGDNNGDMRMTPPPAIPVH
jgi:penicillin-binding protein 1A